MGLIVLTIVAAIPFAIGIKIFLWSTDYLIAPISDIIESLFTKQNNTAKNSKGIVEIKYVIDTLEKDDKIHIKKMDGGVEFSKK